MALLFVAGVMGTFAGKCVGALLIGCAIWLALAAPN
jgi:hypothetical protein